MSKNNNKLLTLDNIILFVGGGIAVYLLYRMFLQPQHQTSRADFGMDFMQDLPNNIMGFEHGLMNFIQNTIRKAGGDPNGSFQNIHIQRNINRGSGGGNIHQTSSSNNNNDDDQDQGDN